MMCKSSERKSIMARYRATDQIYLIYLQYCEQFPNSKFVCKSSSLFCKFISCRDDFLFGVKRSLKPPVFECNTDGKNYQRQMPLFKTSLL